MEPVSSRRGFPASLQEEIAAAASQSAVSLPAQQGPIAGRGAGVVPLIFLLDPEITSAAREQGYRYTQPAPFKLTD